MFWSKGSAQSLPQLPTVPHLNPATHMVTFDATSPRIMERMLCYDNPVRVVNVRFAGLVPVVLYCKMVWKLLAYGTFSVNVRDLLAPEAKSVL